MTKKRLILLVILMVELSSPSFAFSLPRTKAIPVGVLGIIAAIYTENENDNQLLTILMDEQDSQYGVLSENHPLSRRLQRVTRGMQTASQIPLDFKVYNENRIVNAFAVANGSVRVFSGLMELLSDEELMAVMAHELGHIVLGHAENAYKSQLLKSSLEQLNPLTKFAMGNMANNLRAAKYSRNQETEADLYAYAYLRNHHVNPCYIIYSLEALRSFDPSDEREVDLLADHPDLSSRIEVLMNQAKKDGYTFELN